MGLFPISPVRRFLDGGDSGEVYSGTKVLVSGFLRAMQAQNIHFKYGMHPLMRDLVQKGAFDTAESQRFGGWGNLLSSIGDDEEMGGGDERIVVEPLEVAVETCAMRMSNLRVIPGVSRGISFGIDVDPSAPDNRWSIVLHYGPLPLLEIALSSLTGFHPPNTFLDSMIQSKSAHIMASGESSLFGDGDHLFLMLKRSKLFPYSKGNSNSEAIAAGQGLQRLCQEVWQKLSGNAETLHELSSWGWKRKRFVRKFDALLLQHAGSDNLDALLKEMGTRLDSWLPACDY